MKTTMTRVFVYGSLRRGQGNHAVLAGATFLGTARIAPEFTLYDLGPFPALVLDGRRAVVGEIYEVDEMLLQQLDRFEGCPRLYQRQLIRLSDGALAHAYVQRIDQVRGRAEVPSGDWVERSKELACALG